MKIGIQLYSLKDKINQDGLESVLKMISEIGYDCVEFPGFYDFSVSEIVEMMNKYNLKCYSTHTAISDVEKQLPYFLALGIKNAYIPWKNEQELQAENFPRLVSEIKSMQELLAKNGIKYGYHNHSLEYENGADKVKDLLDAIDNFYSELDIFWVRANNISPVAKMLEYGKRVNSLHIKEMDKRTTSAPGEFANPIIGDGICEVKEVFALAKKLNIELCILEVEYFCCDEKEYLQKSLVTMRNFAK